MVDLNTEPLRVGFPGLTIATIAQQAAERAMLGNWPFGRSRRRRALGFGAMVKIVLVKQQGGWGPVWLEQEIHLLRASPLFAGWSQDDVRQAIMDHYEAAIRWTDKNWDQVIGLYRRNMSNSPWVSLRANTGETGNV